MLKGFWQNFSSFWFQAGEYSVPGRTLWTYREYKVHLFLVLHAVILFDLNQLITSLRDKSLTTFHSSVARTCIFQWCTETELSTSKNSLQQDVKFKNSLPLYITLKLLSCNQFILLFNLRLRNVHGNVQ